MTTRSPIRVSDNRHYLQHADGRPFFYLADTAWLLFNKLTIEEADELFADRAAKGFTAIQACVFRDLFEPNTPNVAGVRPFATDEDLHAVRLNPAWLEHVVRVVRRAQEHNLVIGLLPTWGDKWNEHSNSAGPVIMEGDSARRYCRDLSDGLAGCENVVWILGGDSPLQTQAYADTVRAMAEGLRAGGSRERLITFHPGGQESSAVFHAEPWLDLNAIQSSHFRLNFPNYVHVERLFAARPPKPCMDAESNYEGISVFATAWRGLQRKGDTVFSAYDVRKAYYRSVLAGAAGHSYGAEPIRQLLRPGDTIHGAREGDVAFWREGLKLPGSSQLALLQRELFSRSYFTRVPAQELLRPYRQMVAWPDPMNVGLPFAGQTNLDPAARISVAKCSEGSWAMAYMPIRQELYLDVRPLAGERFRLSVFDPETGELQDRREFDPPRVDPRPRLTPMHYEDGVLLYIPKRDTDTFFTIDAL